MAIARRMATRLVDCGAAESGPSVPSIAVLPFSTACGNRLAGSRRDFVQVRGDLFGFAPFFRFSVCDDPADEQESRKCE